MGELDNVLREFLIESHESLDLLDRDLVQIESDPHDRPCLDRIFRTIHTIKGTCGFFGLPKLEGVSHSGENLLCAMRDGLLIWNTEITSAMLALVDVVREVLGRIESTGSDGDESYESLIRRLESLLPGGVQLDLDEPRSEGETEAEVEEDATPPISATETPAPLATEGIESLIAARSTPPPPRFPSNSAALSADPPPEHPTSTGGSKELITGGNIRVNVGLLDKLMNLVGELVLARNQILQHSTTRKDPSFLSTTQRLNLITTELQEGVMKTRMQPIGTVWDKFPRVVRDLAVMCGKNVRIEMEGKETELDKTIIEAIKDPLTHIVRNSVDHGIESPQDRARRGKSATATLRLRAFHESGQVNIEITDDGAGIAPEKILAKALERGLITRDAASRLSTHEIVQLIFLPGFSTAEKITNISGRGVGMDVVKTNIEKIAGTVDIISRVGQGTTVRIKIPLTLAIIPALIVTTGEERFAIPQVNLLELVRLEGDNVRHGIEMIHGAPVYRLRGRLLPLLYLTSLLRIKPTVRPEEDSVNIVILQSDDRRFGLIVDTICDTEEIVVKPLAKQLKNIDMFAGATIMGDGRVSLILDISGIAGHIRILAKLRERHLSDLMKEHEAIRDDQDLLLLVQLGKDRRFAIPLQLVDRLEEVASKNVEYSMGTEVVQYRGRIMPLLRLSDALKVRTSELNHSDPMQIVVYSEGSQSAGVVVDRILDIVKSPSTFHRTSGGLGVIGSAVIQNQVTDLINLPKLVRSRLAEFFEADKVARGA